MPKPTVTTSGRIDIGAVPVALKARMVAAAAAHVPPLSLSQWILDVCRRELERLEAEAPRGRRRAR